MSIDSLLKVLYESYHSDTFAFDFFDRGGAGDDTLTGTEGNDRLVGMAGNDTMTGLGGHDLLKGYTGDDTLYGNLGSDALLGGHGDDRLFGGGGDDVLLEYRGNDFMDGGDGDDFLYVSYGLNHMVGGTGNDTLIGGIRSDLMYGGDGEDKMSGGSGADEMYGGIGNDRMQGYFGKDRLYGEGGNDTLMADGGADVLRGGNGHDVINKYSFINLPTKELQQYDPGFTGHEFHIREVNPIDYPGMGRDRSGADKLFGGNGNDKIYIGKDDEATGGSGADNFAFVFTGFLGRTDARITDFDASEDSLTIAYTSALSSAPRAEVYTKAELIALGADYVEEANKLDAADLMVLFARTDTGSTKNLREIGIIENGAGLGLTASDITFETIDF